MDALSGKIELTRALASERLTFTPAVVDDFNDCVRMWQHESTTKFMGGKPLSPEQVWSRLLRHVGHWTVLGFGFWTLRERATGAFVGEAGFYNLRRDVEPSPGDIPEAGWVLAPEARGKGYAREAVSTIHRWGDEHFPVARTVCLIDPLNTPSMRVAVDCGYRPVSAVKHQGNDLLLLER